MFFDCSGIPGIVYATGTYNIPVFPCSAAFVWNKNIFRTMNFHCCWKRTGVKV
jgi:hypothetical protein